MGECPTHRDVELHAALDIAA